MESEKSELSIIKPKIKRNRVSKYTPEEKKELTKIRNKKYYDRVRRKKEVTSSEGKVTEKQKDSKEIIKSYFDQMDILKRDLMKFLSKKNLLNEPIIEDIKTVFDEPESIWIPQNNPEDNEDYRQRDESFLETIPSPKPKSKSKIDANVLKMLYDLEYDEIDFFKDIEGIEIVNHLVEKCNIIMLDETKTELSKIMLGSDKYKYIAELKKTFNLKNLLTSTIISND